MLSDVNIQKMKQTNISVDSGKTGTRLGELWQAAGSDGKTAVTQLAGINRPSVARAIKTGTISAKLAVAAAQALNINPFYLTGESDEQSEFSEETLARFLEWYNYADLLKEQSKSAKKATRKPRKQAAAVALEPVEVADEPEVEAVIEYAAAPVVEPAVEAAPVCVCEPAPVAPIDLAEDDMVLLLRALLLRAKSGGAYAETADKIKALLLS